MPIKFTTYSNMYIEELLLTLHAPYRISGIIKRWNLTTINMCPPNTQIQHAFLWHFPQPIRSHLPCLTYRRVFRTSYLCKYLYVQKKNHNFLDLLVRNMRKSIICVTTLSFSFIYYVHTPQASWHKSTW